jgi:hypothetical protein
MSSVTSSQLFDCQLPNGNKSSVATSSVISMLVGEHAIGKALGRDLPHSKSLAYDSVINFINFKLRSYCIRISPFVGIKMFCAVSLNGDEKVT